MEIKKTIFVGGLYPNAQVRHKHQTDKRKITDFLSTDFFQPIDDPIAADIYLAIDYNSKAEALLRLRRSKDKPSILFRSEPACVSINNFTNRLPELFTQVISFGRSKNWSLMVENWPQFWPREVIVFDNSQPRINKAVMVNSNHISFHKDEQYSLRRICVKKITQIDLFGQAWDMSFNNRMRAMFVDLKRTKLRKSLPKISGTRYWFSKWPEIDSPVEKNTVIEKYKVSLVIENSLDYMSEKLFDVLFSGCIPVYVGPDISFFGIPESLVVQVNPSVDSIKEGIKRALAMDMNMYQSKLAVWLNSSEAKQAHSGEKVLERATNLMLETIKL
jgi:hypothetical protein